MPDLLIRLLGIPELVVAGETVSNVPAKAVALLAFLAMEPRTYTRERIANLLWPDGSEQTVRRNLRQTLWRLRTALPDAELVQSSGDGLIALNTSVPYMLDAAEFARLASGSPEDQDAALALYRDDFMIGFFVQDAPEFEDWTYIERERLKQTFDRTLRALIDLHTGRGAWDTALAYVQRGLAHDLLDESLYAQGMTLHARSGNRHAAMELYERLRHVLDSELGVVPLPETDNLYDDIVNGQIEVDPDMSHGAIKGEQTAIRVLLVDDHAVVRSGLRALLKAEVGITVVGEAENGREGLTLCAQLQPDIVLMDVDMPQMNGIEATTAIKRRWPEIEVITLTSTLEDAQLRAVLEAGSTGYLLKDGEPDDIVRALRQTHTGKIHLDSRAAARLSGDVQLSVPALGTALGQREFDVIYGLAQGWDDAQIAQELKMPESAVSLYVGSILGKLRLYSRTQIVVYALKHGLISLDDLTLPEA